MIVNVDAFVIIRSMRPKIPKSIIVANIIHTGKLLSKKANMSGRHLQILTYQLEPIRVDQL